MNLGLNLKLNSQLDINSLLYPQLVTNGNCERFGVDLLEGWSLLDGWLTNKATIIDADTFTSNGANGLVYKNSVLSANAYYMLVVAADASAGDWRVRASGSNVNFLEYGDGDGVYFANVGAANGIFVIESNNNGAVIDVNTLELYKWTPPLMGSVTAWVDYQCAILPSNEQANGGQYSMKLTGNVAAANCYAWLLDGSDCGLVSGRTYTSSVDVYKPSGQGINNVVLYYRNNSGQTIILDYATSTDTWVTLSGDFVDDDVERTVQIGFNHDTDIDGLSVFWDNFSCKPTP